LNYSNRFTLTDVRDNLVSRMGRDAYFSPRPNDRSSMSNYLAWLPLTGVAEALLALAVHRSHASRLRSSSRLGLTIATLVVLLVGCAHGARLGQVGNINCQAANGDYVYGEFGWSTIPPGPTCTFTTADHGFDEVRGPSPVMSVWLALLAAGTATSVAVMLRSEHDSERPNARW
jgi:hypothetical protein